MANGRINKPAGRNSNTSKQEIVIRTDRPVVVDATNHIAGRLASNVAKLLLQGQRVTVVNCEKIMMSGTRANQIKEYREFLEINSIINYKHGPIHYRRPDTIIAKMIRQMYHLIENHQVKQHMQDFELTLVHQMIQNQLKKFNLKKH